MVMVHTISYRKHWEKINENHERCTLKKKVVPYILLYVSEAQLNNVHLKQGVGLGNV